MKAVDSVLECTVPGDRWNRLMKREVAIILLLNPERMHNVTCTKFFYGIVANEQNKRNCRG